MVNEFIICFAQFTGAVGLPGPERPASVPTGLSFPSLGGVGELVRPRSAAIAATKMRRNEA